MKTSTFQKQLFSVLLSIYAHSVVLCREDENRFCFHQEPAFIKLAGNRMISKLKKNSTFLSFYLCFHGHCGTESYPTLLGYLCTLRKTLYPCRGLVAHSHCLPLNKLSSGHTEETNPRENGNCLPFQPISETS